MFSRPKSAAEVWRNTFFASLFSVAVTVTLVPLTFDLENLVSDLIKCAAIALLCSVPVSWLMGNEMRKNEELTKVLRDLVNRDRLTDAATRDYFFEQMESDPNRFGVSLMIDIDHFKAVNDTYGHLVGDKVIRSVAEALRRTVRDEDIVCRFGGEEFVVFLANHKPELGVEVAERMRVAIEKEVVRIQETAISVTVSIGGSLKDAMTDINDAIKVADDALYRAKAGGRNQTIFASAAATQASAATLAGA